MIPLLVFFVKLGLVLGLIAVGGVVLERWTRGWSWWLG